MAEINMAKKDHQGVDDQLRIIQVHVFGPDQAVVTFTVYVDMPMSNLMHAYCHRTRTIPVHTESNNMRLKSSINVNLIEPMNDKVTQLKINMHVTMSTLMHGFCGLTNQSMNAVRFLLDGQPLAENDTAASLNLKNGASIEVWFK